MDLQVIDTGAIEYGVIDMFISNGGRIRVMDNRCGRLTGEKLYFKHDNRRIARRPVGDTSPKMIWSDNTDETWEMPPSVRFRSPKIDDQIAFARLAGSKQSNVGFWTFSDQFRHQRNFAEGLLYTIRERRGENEFEVWSGFFHEEDDTIRTIEGVLPDVLEPDQFIQCSNPFRIPHDQIRALRLLKHAEEVREYSFR